MPLDLPWLHELNKKTIVLGSGSPRRREILTDLGVRFQVVTTLKPDENDPHAYATPTEYVADTALMKAKEIFQRCKEDPSLPKADVVIGADTVVVVDNKVLEKPHDAADAKRMLRMLSGRSHETLTGVQILIAEKDGGGYKQHSFVECTRVRFFEIDDETLDAYVVSGEPFDKAGAYGIQGSASLFIQGLDGDYWNVVGLPKARLYKELESIFRVT
ncbi:hypothetical protein VTP01DRAFT_6921 [Rhizomucor pusillus]|uniref:uncharacterized protein n=1 Tax=Rhizomucor pusillus TaxID=4840 RepID=UPI0037420401